MGRRGQARVHGILPVRIWGTDRDGHPFSEHVCTMDISAKGARLAGVHAPLAVGDSIGIQYRNRQARFRIKWIAVASGAAAETHVGVERLQPDKELWPVNLPAGGADPYEVPGIHKEDRRKIDRRRHTRFAVSGKACVSAVTGGQGVWVKVGDISLTGCYLETGDPLNVGHRVKLLIKVADTQIEANAVVRASYPASAMGIEFTFMSDADRRKLTYLIAQLEQCDPVQR